MKQWFRFFRPHNAPTRTTSMRRLAVEVLEDRSLPAVSLLGTGVIAALPSNVSQHVNQTGPMLVVSPESQQRILGQAVTVDRWSPGANGPESFVGVNAGLGTSSYYSHPDNIPAGTLVNSYYGRLDSPDVAGRATATLTFTGESIIGIVYESDTLDGSDSSIGLAGVTYGHGEPARGAEITRAEYGDGIIVYNPHQITLSFTVGGYQDVARIITVNDPPQVTPQSFSVSESAEAGATVGTVAATPSRPGDALSYSLIAGNTYGTFAVNPATGQITVANATALDFETHPQSILQVQVTDQRGHSGTNFVTVNIQNAPPSTPVDSNAAANCPFVTATNGEPVGLTVHAADPHGGAVTYSLTNNAGGRFAIDTQTGVVTVANRTLMQGNTDYTLSAQANDGHGGISSASFHVFSTSLPDASPAVLTAQGDAYYAQGLYQEASYLYGIVIEMTPQNPTIFEKRGDALSALGMLNDAVYAYTVSANLAPGNAAIFEKLGLAQVANNQLNAGIYSLTVAVGLAPSSGLYKLHLGEAQYLAGLHDAARYSFTWAMVNDQSLTGYIHTVYGDLF